MFLFKKRKSSDIFVPSDSGFVEYQGERGDGSINAITQALGWELDHTYTIFRDLEHRKIVGVIFELFTQNIIFVVTRNNTKNLAEREVCKYLADFTVEREFDSVKIADTLNDGIENASLSISFLARVLNLSTTAPNGMFYSDRIKAYLYFTDGVLTDFQYDDGFFPWARLLMEVNKPLYSCLAETAYSHWPGDDFQAKKEINIQCEAWSNIPNAFGNEYVPLHQTPNGGANLHMLRVCHYGYPITLSQFKEINNGRYTPYEEFGESKFLSFKCGAFVYTFDHQTEKLIKFEQIYF